MLTEWLTIRVCLNFAGSFLSGSVYSKNSVTVLKAIIESWDCWSLFKHH